MRRLVPYLVILVLAVVAVFAIRAAVSQKVDALLPPWLDPKAEAEYRAARDSLAATLETLRGVEKERDGLRRAAAKADARAQADQRAAVRLERLVLAAQARTDSALAAVIADSARADTVLSWLQAERKYYGERIHTLAVALATTQRALEAERQARLASDSALALTRAALTQATGRLKTADRWADWGKAAMAGAAVVVLVTAVK